jgi:selenocysteine-specific elongation factor
MVTDILAELKEKKTLSAAEVRDHFGTSRRYVLALLEHLDAEGLTLREGDVRRLKA